MRSCELETPTQCWNESTLASHRDVARKSAAVFVTHCEVPSIHQRLILTGNTEAVGKWNVFKGIYAREYPRGSGHWTASVCIDRGTQLKYKWVVLDQTNIKVHWESLRKNRKATIPDQDVCVIRSITGEPGQTITSSSAIQNGEFILDIVFQYNSVFPLQI